MIRPPGTFSQNYLSNPAHARLSKDRRKENRNPNGTFDNCDLDLTIAVSQSNTPVKEPAKFPKQSSLAHRHKLQEDWRKKEKELSGQVSRLKKECSKHKQALEGAEGQMERLRKENQENIYQYEQYIKEMKKEKKECARKGVQYEKQLRYCILWLVEIFCKVSESSRPLDMEGFVSRFQPLGPVVEQLQLEKQLHKVTNHPSSLLKTGQQEDYLLEHLTGQQDHLTGQQDHLTKQQDHLTKQQDHLTKQQEYLTQNQEYLIEGESFISTFDQRRQQCSVFLPDISRRLFDKDSEGADEGECTLQDEESTCFEGQRVVALNNYCKGNEDYLEVEAGKEVKLLKKVGSVWIAESGNKIGYVEETAFRL